MQLCSVCRAKLAHQFSIGVSVLEFFFFFFVKRKIPKYTPHFICKFSHFLVHCFTRKHFISIRAHFTHIFRQFFRGNIAIKSLKIDKSFIWAKEVLSTRPINPFTCRPEFFLYRFCVTAAKHQARCKIGIKVLPKYVAISGL